MFGFDLIMSVIDDENRLHPVRIISRERRTSQGDRYVVARWIRAYVDRAWDQVWLTEERLQTS